MNPSDPSLDEKTLSGSIDIRPVDWDQSSRPPQESTSGLRGPHTPPPIPDHELLRIIGRGAYGEVWLARNIMGTYRAVKVVYRDNFESDRPFEREFSGIQSFEPVSRSHESQVDILHVGRNEELRCFYYVMELADDASSPLAGASGIGGAGNSETARVPTTPTQLSPDSYRPRTVRNDLKLRGRYSFAEAIEISLALATALDHLHRHGLIHRDIKPANVIFVNGRPKLADIGLVTETGSTMSFVGTEGYLPPEGPGSVQADVYSLGITLYELATGKDRLEFPELPTMADSSVDEAGLFELNEVLLKACHSDREQRYQTADELHADLVLLQAGKSIRRSRALEKRLALLTKVAAGVLMAAALSVAAYVYQNVQTREARQLAMANHELAAKETAERRRAEGLVNTLQLKQAESLFEKDEGNQGVAYLARLLRQNPSNQIAAARLMSALTDRSFATPVWSLKPWDSNGGADFSPDGRLLVTWGKSGTNCLAQLKEVATGRDVGRPMYHSEVVRRARFSPDGRFLATMAKDGNARLWDGVTGEPLSGVWPPIGEGFRGDQIVEEHLAFSPDSQMLVTASLEEARLWKVPTGELLVSRFDHGSTVWDVGFSPDGRLVSTSGQTQTRIWDIASGTLRHILDIGDGDNRCLARFSPDGRRIVGVGGFHFRVWDVGSGEQILALHRDCNVTSAAFSPDGVRLATADTARTVQIIDASTGRQLFQPILHGDQVEEVSFDGAGERILTRERRRARVWDSRTGRPLTEWMLPPGVLQTAQFIPSGTHVLTATSQGNITLWDVRPAQALNLALPHSRALVPSARFNGDGTRVVTAGGGVYPTWYQDGFGEAMVWDARTGAQLGARIATSLGIQYSEFSPDGRWVVTASLNGQTRVWDAQAGVALLPPLRHSESVTSARFSLDGQRLVTASNDGSARVWDSATGRPLGAAMEHSNRVVHAEFSPDGLSVLVVPDLDAARVWDVQSGRLTGSFGQLVLTARFSPDGHRLVTGDSDGVGQVWDLKTGQARGKPLRHRDLIYSVRFSPDGRLVVTASKDQSARVWDVLTGSPVAEPLHHDGAVLDAVFSPEGHRVVTASEDYTARVWDVRTGQPLSEPLREGHFVGGAEFSPDGTRLVTATANSLARIWDLPPVRLEVPAWLSDLAEAMAGANWTEQGVLEPVSPTEYLTRRAEFLKVAESDDQNRWLRWLLADRGSRTVSYASSATCADYLDRLLQQAQERPLREALLLSPGHPLGAARLAKRLMDSEFNEVARYPQRERQADFLSERAVSLAPEHGEVLRIRSDVLDKSGRREEALAAIEQAIVLAGSEPESWFLKGRLLEGVGRKEEALGAYRKALEARQSRRATEGIGTGNPIPQVVREDGLARGVLRREVFSELPDNRLSSLTNQLRFPDLPDRVDFVSQFEAPNNFADNFGIRLSGYLVPPKTGEYRFYLNSDDEGALFLSTDDSPKNVRAIAHEPWWNPPRAWSSLDLRPNRENVSTPLHLEAGRRYYVEAVMKEGVREDNLAVAWQPPGEPPPEPGSPPIPGKYLAVPTEWLDIAR